MTRFFKMTKEAQQALWGQLSNGANHIPTQFMVEGDAKSGYEISSVNDDLCGFTLITLRSFYATKQFIAQTNELGTNDWKKHCSVGSFAWANHPMPLVLSGSMKVIDVDPKNILTTPF